MCGSGVLEHLIVQAKSNLTLTSDVCVAEGCADGGKVWGHMRGSNDPTADVS